MLDRSLPEHLILFSTIMNCVDVYFHKEVLVMLEATTTFSLCAHLFMEVNTDIITLKAITTEINKLYTQEHALTNGSLMHLRDTLYQARHHLIKHNFVKQPTESLSFGMHQAPP